MASLRMPNIMAEEVPGKPVDFYTCPFRRSKIDRFLGSDNQQTYFSSVQRSRVLYEILSTAMFGKKKKGEVGIDRLVEEGVFSTAFSLHDGPYRDPSASPGGPGPCTMNPRQVLYEYWARWGEWYRYQPLDHIRDYFGEKIAIYFAWLGFYTGWLLPAALVGVLVFMYGLFTINDNPLANQVCHSGGSFKMCPLCDENIGCKYWDLSDVCGYARLAYLFDHPGTVFYAIFISLWAVTFLEYWKRKCASLAHHWDCTGFQEEEERPRPEFAARAPFLERNPVTGVREPSFPASLRTKRVAAGIGIIFLMMSLVIIFIVAVIIYRVLVSIPLFQNATFRSQAQSIANLTGAVVNLVLIMAMSRVYEKLAFRLTSWEMHRTQTEFDDNLTFKVFIFQFVNFYSSIFYIAFFKGRFVGYPGNYTLILRLRNEDCSAGGCLIELAQQLAVIMIGKQMINNAQELLVPKLKAWWQKKQVKLPRKRDKTRWEEDYQLIDSEGLFQEYLEMVLQFGFITIFVAAFPLAPLFALLNNWVEIRLDAHKLYEYHWNLDGYVNFTLSYSPEGTLSQQCRYRGMRDPTGKHTPFFWRLLAVRFAFVIIFEHVVFGICRLIDVLVPDIPESLELKIKRERYLAKQALQDSDTILRVAANHTDEEEQPPPFGGMVLDLTSELGALMPSLLIAAPSSSELARAAQEAMAGPSVLKDLLSPAPSSNLSASTPSRSPVPDAETTDTLQDKKTEKKSANQTARSRPRPRPRTVTDVDQVVTSPAGLGAQPRHSMSATAISTKLRGNSRTASVDNSGTNTASRSPQSVPDTSLFEYVALQGADGADTMSFVSSGEDGGEAEDEATDLSVSRRRARITVKRRDRPASAFVGEVIADGAAVHEVLRRSVPSKLDQAQHVVVTIPQQHDWPDSSSVSEASSTEESVFPGALARGLAGAAAQSAISVGCLVHPPSTVPGQSSVHSSPRKTRGLGSFSVGSDLSSLVSQDPDSFSDLHLRHGIAFGSPKKTPTKIPSVVAAPPPLREHSDSLGSDISSLAGQDAEQWAEVVVEVDVEEVTEAVNCGPQQSTGCLPAPPALTRASSSKGPRRERQMPPRDQSVSVTSGLNVTQGVSVEEQGLRSLRHAGACFDINRVGSASRDEGAFPVRSPASESSPSATGSGPTEASIHSEAVSDIHSELHSEAYSVAHSLSSDSLERKHSNRSSGMSFGSESATWASAGLSQVSRASINFEDEASWPSAPSSWSRRSSREAHIEEVANAGERRRSSGSSMEQSERVGFRLASTRDSTSGNGGDPRLFLDRRGPPPPPPPRRRTPKVAENSQRPCPSFREKESPV
ncbi:hypothetical protein FOCC_FOCC003555 [Frankliniella occidentalis]|nr:hypothetical protein FOCC_FOCC003555 [Frankliniella occidentalis]